MQSLEQHAHAEFISSKAELQRLPATQAVVRFYARQDAAIRNAAVEAPKSPACKINWGQIPILFS